MLQEDPEAIGGRLRLVADNKATYGVHNDDVHNFVEIGFQMSIIGSMKVEKGSERRARPDLIQPGDPEWTLVIQSMCAAGYPTLQLIICKERVHISAWYEEADIPHKWKH